ncbi:CmlA/FloR family chloramphenicol efflux MFS transporter [Phreatobacter sp. AB_2022a]|uniref:CmlA/FloR family chloramphenicol efflux MFS transporter n=1 Tax=Phreatobacter sp. AB_2022a TaxID=3003134 RepID=UPI0022871077|nr:CmlA/FloR family chloramphenicol efflux MFS transporter [Phreatobacter sp. AB_2022a]MCZ0734952.1 CmlA/FloR family chloramphenicol efflux MFS transporter [Phreatobacter sp. AB_2022a]
MSHLIRPAATAQRRPPSLPSALLLMAPFDLIASLAMDIYLPVVPLMPGALDASPGLVQLTLSLYMAALGLGQVLFGPLSDRIGRRPVVIGGALLFATASFGLAATSSGPVFVALRAVQGLAASATLVATFATVRDVYADRPEGTLVYGLFSAMLAFVPALGPILGALIAWQWGWRAIFATLGLLALAAALQALARWPETRPDRARIPARRSGAILRSGAFWTYTLGFAAAMGTFFVFFSIAPRILISRLGLSELAFSIAFASVALVMIVVARLARGLPARRGIDGTLVRGLGIMLAGAGLLAGLSGSGGPSLAAILAPMWVMAAGMVLVVSVTANGALAGFDDRAGAAVALYYAVQSAIVGAAGTLAVIALPADTAWPLVAYCAAMGTITLAALGLLRRSG